jgi:hypothetical protein
MNAIGEKRRPLDSQLGAFFISQKSLTFLQRTWLYGYGYPGLIAGVFSYLALMPASHPLAIQVVQVDIIAQGKHVGTAFRLTTGYWQFHDLENDWREEYPVKLELDQLLEIFIQIRRRRGQAARARSARKEK